MFRARRGKVAPRATGTMVELFAASFAVIFLRTLAAQAVIARKWSWIMPLSIALAAADAFIWVHIVRTGFELWPVLIYGVGSGVGALGAMWLHRRLHHD